MYQSSKNYQCTKMEDPFLEETRGCDTKHEGVSETELGNIDASMEDTSNNIKMADVSKTWTAPDASFSKRIIKHGAGFTSPNDGASCQITFTMLDLCASQEQLDIGYPCREKAGITLGDGCGTYSEVVDACLETMHRGEECELHILGRNESEGISRSGDQRDEVTNMRVTTNTYGDEGAGRCRMGSLFITLHDFTRNKDIFEMTVADILSRVRQLKEFGTRCFKERRQELAEKFYIRAVRYLISVCHPKNVQDLEDAERREYHELKRACSLNLAACQLKHKRYSDVIVHCTYALEDDPMNSKALYRRCQAYRALDEFESARADIDLALRNDPKNKAFLEQQRLLVKREKQVYNKLSKAMTKMFGGSA